MSSSKINIDKLSLQVMNDLYQYQKIAIDVVEEAVKKTAKQTVKDIKANIASAGINGNDYKKSWRYKRDDSLPGKWRYSMVVFSEKYQLPHLLERGHRTRNGKTTRDFEHIAPAEKVAEENIIKFLKEGLEQ